MTIYLPHTVQAFHGAVPRTPDICGYEISKGKTKQIFNTDDTCLFYSIKNFTDQGYRVTCLDKKVGDHVYGRTGDQLTKEGYCLVFLFYLERKGRMYYGK